MSWSAVAFLALASTAVWGLLMTGLFAWPRETILAPMGLFGLVMFAVLAGMKLLRDRRGTSRSDR